jgi:hypothetical protein
LAIESVKVDLEALNGGCIQGINKKKMDKKEREGYVGIDGASRQKDRGDPTLFFVAGEKSLSLPWAQIPCP